MNKLLRYALIVLIALAVILARRAMDMPTEAIAAEVKPAPEFAKEGVAFLQKHCVACHSGPKPKADLDFESFKDDMALLKERKRWQDVLRMATTGEMPPKEKPRPTAGEVDLLVKSVNTAFDRADRNAKPDPGRVTVRRLNKVEYNNTIRDLVGVDFNPSEDFPSDDVGYGFDNIGDVLTLSPVLMERYLAAAEAIMNRAVTPVPPPVTVRWQSTQFSEPAAAKIPFANQYRSLKLKGDHLETGPIFIRYQAPAEGEFNFRTRIYAETEGKKSVKVAVLAGQIAKTADSATDKDIEMLSGAALKQIQPFRIIQILEVKARSAKEAEQTTIKLPTNPGIDKMAIALVKPDKDEPSPTVYVQFMSLDGPLDSRPDTHRKLLACAVTKPKAEQTHEVLGRFASKAYRRPATTDEVERLAKLVEAVEAKGEKWEAGIQLAMQAVLVSPKFLFRLELDSPPADAGGSPVALDEYQLASRLSYFLWSSMPDYELFDLAAKKQLTANLDAQVKRMLKDPRARALVDNFVMQWLQLRNLRNFQPDPKQFPEFNDKLRAAMFKETELFFEAIVKEDRSILDIIDADYTFLNAPLARHYGIADTNGNWTGQKAAKPAGKSFREDAFERVSLQGGMRGGILTQASVLAVTSNPTRTSPVKRGRWVLEQLLGTPPPPPPPNVPELPTDAKAAATGSLRKRLEQHRANPSCANCHAKMDPLGFAFENFNAVGAFRTKDGDFPIDPSGELPDGKKFQGPAELKQILKEKKDLFSRCLAEKMLTYAVGRGIEYYDKRAVDKICENLAKDGYKFSTLVTEVVKSEPFRMKRGK
jgi:hypothetical protein